MSQEETSERKRAGSYFRTIMDVGMGIFYTIIGGMIIVFKSFAQMRIPTIIAYVLGAMMLIGGLFRLYRGVTGILSNRRRA